MKSIGSKESTLRNVDSVSNILIFYFSILPARTIVLYGVQ